MEGKLKELTVNISVNFKYSDEEPHPSRVVNQALNKLLGCQKFSDGQMGPGPETVEFDKINEFHSGPVKVTVGWI